MLAIGYPIYWSETLSGTARTGVTSPLATMLFVFFAVFVLFRERQSIINGFQEYRRGLSLLNAGTRAVMFGILGLAAAILLIAFYAATFPVHLQQEGDALNYHYSLTRQHLIIGSFAHIPWSAFDLFLLPVDYALAPFWFVTELPNKIPQFLFLLGLVGILSSFLRFLKGKVTTASFLLLGFLAGSHGHGIQFGTAMLDLVNCYLFFAMADSMIRRVHWLFIIEANFYIWAKPFVPLQSAAIIMVLWVLVLTLKRAGFKDVYLDFQKRMDPEFFLETVRFLKRCVFGLIVTTAMVGGPFIAKSIYYTGTPFYPLAPGLIKAHQIPEGSVAWSSLAAASDYCMNRVLNNYGYGRSLIDFINHFWLIAVPIDGVNNRFDYPIGLSYLLAVGPFVFLLWKALQERKIAILPLFAVIFWMVWFMGPQQSRWLYVPMILMFLTVAAEVRPSKILWAGLVLALVFNLISVGRAYRGDLTKNRQDVLRDKDKALLELNSRYLQERRSGYVFLDDSEVAFARFPVMIRKENLPNTVAF